MVLSWPNLVFFYVKVKAAPTRKPGAMIYSVRSEQYCVFLSFASQRAWYRTYDPVQDSSADVVSADC